MRLEELGFDPYDLAEMVEEYLVKPETLQGQKFATLFQALGGDGSGSFRFTAREGWVYAVVPFSEDVNDFFHAVRHIGYTPLGLQFSGDPSLIGDKDEGLALMADLMLVADNLREISRDDAERLFRTGKFARMEARPDWLDADSLNDVDIYTWETDWHVMSPGWYKSQFWTTGEYFPPELQGYRYVYKTFR